MNCENVLWRRRRVYLGNLTHNKTRKYTRPTRQNAAPRAQKVKDAAPPAKKAKDTLEHRQRQLTAKANDLRDEYQDRILGEMERKYEQRESDDLFGGRVQRASKTSAYREKGDDFAVFDSAVISGHRKWSCGDGGEDWY